MTRRITVRALRNFYHGPRHANGSREVAIAAGEVRTIKDPAPDARADDPEPTGTRDGLPFHTTTRHGSAFGLCRIGREYGWEVVALHVAKPRQIRTSAEVEIFPQGGGFAWERDPEPLDADDPDWPI